MMSTPEVEPSPQQPVYLDAPQSGGVIRPLPTEVAATDAANPYAMLPLCHTCGQRVPHGSATHGGGVWTCLRCWGGWLAGVPDATLESAAGRSSDGNTEGAHKVHCVREHS